MKEAAVDVEIVAEFGHPIRDVAAQLRRAIVDGVEMMTGRSVVEVNVYVVDVKNWREPRIGNGRLWRDQEPQDDAVEKLLAPCIALGFQLLGDALRAHARVEAEFEPALVDRAADGGVCAEEQ